MGNAGFRILLYSCTLMVCAQYAKAESIFDVIFGNTSSNGELTAGRHVVVKKHIYLRNISSGSHLRYKNHLFETHSDHIVRAARRSARVALHQRVFRSNEPDSSADNVFDSKEQQYLRSMQFSERFRPRAGKEAEIKTKEAVEFIIHNDLTLRPGDALMTQAGVLIFDDRGGDDGTFIALQDSRIRKALKARLVGLEAFSEPNKSTGALLRPGELNSDADRQKFSARDARTPKSDAWTIVKTPDGRSIRMVGGFAN